MATLELPTVDLAVWLRACAASADPADDAAAASACALVARTLHETGVLIVRDPRVPPEANDAFLDMLEEYWAQTPEATAPDEHPELHFQVGRTPPRAELPRNHCARFKSAAFR